MNAPTLATAWPKARYTVAQIWGLIEHDLINADARFELIDGEIVDMSPKGPLHEEVRQAIIDWLVASVSSPLTWLPETTLYLDERAFLEPDFVIFDRSLPIRDLTANKLRLVIEVGHESWRYDTVAKAQRYAEHGVYEYWAVHAPSRLTRVHRGASATGWSEVRELAAGEAVVALCAPNAPLTLTK